MPHVVASDPRRSATTELLTKVVLTSMALGTAVPLVFPAKSSTSLFHLNYLKKILFKGKRGCHT